MLTVLCYSDQVIAFILHSENLTFLLKALRGGKKEESKTVVFVLEEFDLFCQHKNQTLLYNLFDVAQSAQVSFSIPISLLNNLTSLMRLLLWDI